MFWLNIVFPHGGCKLKESGKQLCEVPGIDFFGCWEHDVPPESSFDDFSDVWVSTPVCYRAHRRISELSGHNCV